MTTVRAVEVSIDSKSMSLNYVKPVLARCFADYERDKSDMSVVGSLRRHKDFWRELTDSPNIINVIEHGYSIPLLKLPGTKFLDNNLSSLKHPTFVRETIDELLTKGAIIELTNPPRVVNPLTVVVKDGKKRMVLDCRYINKFVFKQKTKIEGAETLKKFLPRATHLFNFDLKAGYHHVEMNPAQTYLLGFSYSDHKDKDRYFCFKVLPFGLTSAGYIFTKLLRVLITHWRRQGIKVVVFFDDALGAGYSFEEAFQHSATVRMTLIKAGFIPNIEKSQWYPVTYLVWLGFSYDLLQQIIKVSSDKLQKILCLIDRIYESRTMPVTALASLTGSIVSLQLAYGDIAFLKSKSCQMVIAACKD